jgi:hypothetical protein
MGFSFGDFNKNQTGFFSLQQINAALSCFLPDEEKRELVNIVKKGVEKFTRD